MARYEAGETLASIAKTYDCSPPAISYIVSRSRARHAADAPAVTEPQLVKTHPHAAAEAPAEAASAAEPPMPNVATAATSPLFTRDAVQPRHGQAIAGYSGNGFTDRDDRDRFTVRNAAAQNPGQQDSGFPGLPPPARPAPTAPAQPSSTRPPEPQRVLHLGFGNGGANHSADHSNGSGAAVPPPERGNADGMMVAHDGRHSNQAAAAQHGTGEHQQPRPAAAARPYDPPRHHYSQPNHQRPGNGDAAKKDGSGSYIDQDLRARVDGDIAAFLSAFDAALAQDTQDSRSALREATDRLLRAGARTRIELERLEARMPLASRDSAAGGESAWRPR